MKPPETIDRDTWTAARRVLKKSSSLFCFDPNDPASYEWLRGHFGPEARVDELPVTCAFPIPDIGEQYQHLVIMFAAEDSRSKLFKAYVGEAHALRVLHATLWEFFRFQSPEVFPKPRRRKIYAEDVNKFSALQLEMDQSSQASGDGFGYAMPDSSAAMNLSLAAMPMTLSAIAAPTSMDMGMAGLHSSAVSVTSTSQMHAVQAAAAAANAAVAASSGLGGADYNPQVSEATPADTGIVRHGDTVTTRTDDSLGRSVDQSMAASMTINSAAGPFPHTGHILSHSIAIQPAQTATDIISPIGFLSNIHPLPAGAAFRPRPAQLIHKRYRLKLRAELMYVD